MDSNCNVLSSNITSYGKDSYSISINSWAFVENRLTLIISVDCYGGASTTFGVVCLLVSCFESKR